MTTDRWNRAACIAEVRRDLWQYTEPLSDSPKDELKLAAALLGWRADEVGQLGALQFVLSDEVGALLKAAPILVRTLTNSSIRAEEITREQIRGPVIWSETYSLRGAGGGPHMWVTAPARRDYQTPENCMFASMLDRVVSIGTATDLTSRPTHADPVEMIANRIDEANDIRQHRMLQQIERQSLSMRDVMKVRTGRARLRYEPVVAAYDAYDTTVERMSPKAVREATSHAGLMTAPNSTLFELLTLFRIVDALNSAGWETQPVGLIDDVLQVRARSRDHRKLTVHYRSVPAALLLGSPVASPDRRRRARGVTPDIVVRWADSGHRDRWLLVRCRLGLRSSAEETARETAEEMRAYTGAYPAASNHDESVPHALGVIWGTGITADATSDVAVCTPDRIGAAIDALVT